MDAGNLDRHVFGLCRPGRREFLAYRHTAPILARVVDAKGATLFAGDGIHAGQAVFLKHGLVADGSIWGHGAYLGPDCAAQALHQMGQITAQAIAHKGRMAGRQRR